MRWGLIKKKLTAKSFGEQDTARVLGGRVENSKRKEQKGRFRLGKKRARKNEKDRRFQGHVGCEKRLGF